jgi:hypothetical protein
VASAAEPELEKALIAAVNRSAAQSQKNLVNPAAATGVIPLPFSDPSVEFRTPSRQQQASPALVKLAFRVVRCAVSATLVGNEN